VLSVDFGGNYNGHIGDVCRMGTLGQADAELVDLIGEIESVGSRTSPVSRAASTPSA
jgi:Xaa-Pro dipeptidase